MRALTYLWEARGTCSLASASYLPFLPPWRREEGQILGRMLPRDWEASRKACSGSQPACWLACQTALAVHAAGASLALFHCATPYTSMASWCTGGYTGGGEGVPGGGRGGYIHVWLETSWPGGEIKHRFGAIWPEPVNSGHIGQF